MSAAGITPYRSQSTNYDRDDRATVAVLATVIAAVTAVLYYVTGSRHADSLPFAAVTLGQSLFISVSPFLLWRVSARGHYDEPQPWWRSQTTLTIGVVVVNAVAGTMAGLTPLSVTPFLAVIGLLSGAIAMVLWILQGRLVGNLLFLAGSAVFATWACGVAASSANGRMARIDPIEVPIASHSIPAIVVPLFFTAILLLAIEVKKDWSESDVTERPLRYDYAAWLFVVVISIGLIPTSALDAMGVGNRNAAFAKSSAIAVPLFLLGTRTAISWWRRKTTSPSLADFIFLLAFAPFVLVSIGVMDPYLMLLLAICGIGIGLLGRLFGDLLMAASALVGITATAATWKLITIPTNGRIAALDSGPVPGAVSWPYFFLLNLFWGWLYIYLRVREERLETVGAIRGAALEGRITDVVVVAIATIVALAGWLTAELTGKGVGFAASASDLDRWLSLSFLMAAAWRWLVQLRRQREDSAPEGGRIGSIRISRLWIAALAIPIGVTVLLNVLRTTLSLRP